MSETKYTLDQIKALMQADSQKGGKAKMPNQRSKVNDLDYALSDASASRRYEKWKAKDPYPNIQPALLNSADIKAYVKKTGMIYPFYEEDLQGASYKVKIVGKILYWKYDDTSSHKEPPKKIVTELNCATDSFELGPDSIAFVALEPHFRIPEYLALRFNLKIQHIYKGLLLGTGPLVDPGFNGKLFIPLHNLTSNTYRFKYGDTLITMEFTKLSGNVQWGNLANATEHSERYIKEEIPESRDVQEYIAKALANDRLDSVVSSIPNALYDSKIQVEEAKKQVLDSADKVSQAQKEAEKIRDQARTEIEIVRDQTQKDTENIRKWTAVTSIASIGLIATLIISSLGFAFDSYNKANERYDEIKQQYIDMQKFYESSIDDLNKKIEKLQLELSGLIGDKDTVNSSLNNQ